ncbi:LAME_0E04280g1_1 [Lachancea meyersii CBS 8951]|uniref:LAME_0E04280g1_1 n=1 Tax=Lachancea meyersii CBS 8951 TaxID=1266667 RepID=A0A1G4JH64_9SACH|nr:LAME_0E04280g1_1 [Lachancea meyersii CBS 8951]
MSYHTPILSLYDLCQAMAYGSGAPIENEGLEGRRAHHSRRHHGRSRHRSDVNNRFAQHPHFYYIPSYYDAGDEDEDEIDEQQYPYYWLGQTARNEPLPQFQQQQQQRRQQPQPEFLTRILREAFGPGQAEREPEETDANGAVSNEEAAEAPSLAAPAGPSDAKTQEDGDADVPTSPPQTTARSEAPSPVPEPLQVSKPQMRRGVPFSPKVNVYDDADAYGVVMALPGASSKSFKIDYHPTSHELLIKGSIDKKFGYDEKNVRVSELPTGKFERSVRLPVVPRIKDEEIKATYCNGLLQIKIPKILNDTLQPPPRRHIVIEDVPDEELEFEKNPNPVTTL